MESGEFSRGRESIRADGGIVMVGNFDVDVAQQLRTGLRDKAYYAALDQGAYSTEDEIIAEIVKLPPKLETHIFYHLFLKLLFLTYKFNFSFIIKLIFTKSEFSDF